MLSFVARRIAIAIPTILILIVFSFVLMYSAPGSPFASERPLPPEVLANIEAKYGLDQPFWTQVGKYIWRIVTDFDFGPSFVQKSDTVNDIIGRGFPVTLSYGLLSFVVAVLVGVTLGAFAAVYHN